MREQTIASRFLEQLGFIEGSINKQSGYTRFYLDSNNIFEINLCSQDKTWSNLPKWLEIVYKDFEKLEIYECLEFIDYCDIVRDSNILNFLQVRAGQYRVDITNTVKDSLNKLDSLLKKLENLSRQSDGLLKCCLLYSTVYIKYEINRFKDLLNIESNDRDIRYLQSDLLKDLSQIYKINKTFSSMFYLAGMICRTNTQKVLDSIEYFNDFLNSINDRNIEFSIEGLYQCGRYHAYVTYQKDLALKYFEKALEIQKRFNIQSELVSRLYIQLALLQKDKSKQFKILCKATDLKHYSYESVRGVIAIYDIYLNISYIERFNSSYIIECVKAIENIKILMDIKEKSQDVLQLKLLWYVLENLAKMDDFNKGLYNQIHKELINLGVYKD